MNRILCKSVKVSFALVCVTFFVFISGCVEPQQNTVFVCNDGSEVDNASKCIIQNQSGNVLELGQEGVSAGNCLSNTRDSPQCKDCCDCLNGTDSAGRKSCRDACATHDFSENSDFIALAAPSVLGPDGDYSRCTGKADSGDCKACCEESLVLECGDYRFCRTACDTGIVYLGNVSGQDGKPPVQQGKNDSKNQPPQGNKTGGQGQQGQNEYNIEQAISDNAQLNTLAFDGLGFLTGNLCSDSFLPPGKVADFFGFQYLRDTTQAGMGHSTDFVTNAANNVLYILNDAQKSKMVALARNQSGLVNEYAYRRYPLMEAFRRNLKGDIPAGKECLSKEAVMEYSADLYEIDATISIQRAMLFSEIIRSLDAEQKAYLDGMVEGGFDSWPALGDQVDKKILSHDEHVLVMTYASEMFGWYAGDVEADTYFCPERQGDYFGGFYIKDAPAIGNAGYTIDESITGDSGEAFINALDGSQKPVVIGIVETQRDAINGVVEKRRAIATELRKLLSGQTFDEAKVISLGREYGSLDGEISYYYATAFSEVDDTLTSSQKSELMRIRNLDNYTCEDSKIYLYSEKIDKPSIEDTDFLFE